MSNLKERAKTAIDDLAEVVNLSDDHVAAEIADDVRDLIIDRAAFMTIGNAAIHAARGLACHLLIR